MRILFLFILALLSCVSEPVLAEEHVFDDYNFAVTIPDRYRPVTWDKPHVVFCAEDKYAAITVFAQSNVRTPIDDPELIDIFCKNFEEKHIHVFRSDYDVVNGNLPDGFSGKPT